MNTKHLNEILPYVLPNCSGLPEEMGMDYGRRSYIEFCRRSGGLVKNLVYDLQDGVADYPLLPPKGYKVSRVNSVTIEGRTVVSPTHDDMCACYGWTGGHQYTGSYAGGSMNGSYGYGPNFWCSCGQYRFRMNGYECLLLQTAPGRDCDGGLVVQVALQPEQNVCEYDADFFDRWCEGISYGVLMRALVLTNTDWYNPQLADSYRRLFQTEIQRAKHKFDLNYSRGPMTMQARRFV